MAATSMSESAEFLGHSQAIHAELRTRYPHLTREASAELAAGMAKRRERYRRNILEYADCLDRLADEMAVAPDARPLYEDVRFIAHRLAGSGGTFGYRDLSSSGADLETLLLSGEDAARVPDDARALAALIRRCAERPITL